MMPGLGKSGMSRMYGARFMVVTGYRLAKSEAIMPLAIRRATPADAPVVVEFNRRLAEETEGVVLDLALLRAGVASALADPAKTLYFVAEDEGVVVGQLALTYEWSDWRNGWIWWIQSVYVCAEARRRGVFRALYEHVHDLARRDPGVIGLRLYVEHENHAAQETYRRLGMERTRYLVLERCPL
jgi:ribosomal protein S18 acetylase RimI-like enzyme